MSAASKYRDALAACLYARDVHGVEKAAEAAAAARIPLGVAVAEITAAVRIPLAAAEIPAGASCPTPPMFVVALAGREAEARVAAVAEVVAGVVVAFCRAHEGKGGLA